MKKKGIIIGCAVALLLIAGIAVVLNINPQKDTSLNSQTNISRKEHHTVFELDDANEIMLETSDFELKFVKNDDVWGIDGMDDASSAKVKAFVFAALTYTSNTMLEGDTAEYGLDTPDAILTLKESDGLEHIVKIGNISSAGDVCFASVDGDQFTMDITQRERLLNNPEYYTEVSRIMIKSDEITEVVIDKGENIIDIYIPKITRFEGNVWKMKLPYEVMANDTFIDEKVLSSISAITLSKKAESLGEERARLTVKTSDLEYTFKIGTAVRGGTPIEYEGEVYLESSSLLSFMDAQLFEYMHKLVSYLHMDDVKSIDMEYGNITHSLKINGDKFIADGTAAKSDASKIFYSYLIGVTANGIYNNEELGDTLFKITFHCTDGTDVNVEYRSINEYTAAVLKNGVSIFTTGIYDVEDLIDKIDTFYM